MERQRIFILSISDHGKILVADTNADDFASNTLRDTARANAASFTIAWATFRRKHTVALFGPSYDDLLMQVRTLPDEQMTDQVRHEALSLLKRKADYLEFDERR